MAYREENSIRMPNYQTGSHHFLTPFYRAQFQHCTNGDSDSPPELDVAIVGAGVGGLAAAIAIRRVGSKVTVYEAASVLSEIGAGIQVPPNSARLLHSWGLEAALKKKSVTPDGLVWRRWQTGQRIAHTRLNPEFEEMFGAPYYVIHRAHLHGVLHDHAVSLGVTIKLASRVARFEPEMSRFVLADGSTIHADFVVAADGLRSTARRTLLGKDYKEPEGCGLAAYRATLSVEDIRADPATAWVVESPNLNLWVGHNTHAMTYSIVGGKVFNMVLTHLEANEPDTWDQTDLLPEMKATYQGWDPTLTKLLDMVTKTQKWPIQQVEVPDSWSSPCGRLVLLGDAAHAMFPNMALGAAMAVEDAATLASCLQHLASKSSLRRAVDLYESLRIPRCRLVQEASVLHGYTLHYPDGPIQQARDAAMRPEAERRHFIASPNQWSDPTTQMWCYAYDAVAEVSRALRNGLELSGGPTRQVAA